MRIIITNDAMGVAQASADLVCDQLQQKPHSVLGLATGSTPIALYEELVHRYHAGRVSFKQATSFNLDEYIGLPGSHWQSYRYFMQQYLFDHIDIEPHHTHVPNGIGEPMAECQHYEQAIQQAGGIDIQVLGLGVNGHIGFNEPSSSLASRTRVKTLTQDTMLANARFFEAHESQPELAITMGIGTIMQAKQIVLLATGEQKAQAVQQLVEGPVSAQSPASVLQFHQRATVIVDESAASLLSQGDYYQWVEQVRQGIDLGANNHAVATQPEKQC